jgi:prepilin-type N-terminal cleavage/methylation domain-containing protein
MAHLKHKTLQTQRGLTLVELMVTIAVIAILATTAVSTMSNMRAKQQVIAAAEEILSKAQRAKSLARKKSEDIDLTVDDKTAVELIQIKDASGEELDKVDISSTHSKVTVTSTHETFGFGFVRGTITAGSATILNDGDAYIESGIAANGFKAKVIFSGQGRIRICSVEGLSGRYDDC